jgi:hypothetical protein
MIFIQRTAIGMQNLNWFEATFRVTGKSLQIAWAQTNVICSNGRPPECNMPYQCCPKSYAELGKAVFDNIVNT